VSLISRLDTWSNPRYKNGLVIEAAFHLMEGHTDKLDRDCRSHCNINLLAEVCLDLKIDHLQSELLHIKSAAQRNKHYIYAADTEILLCRYGK
jgi:hypothetical protein